MKVQSYRVALAEDGRNVLVREEEWFYSGSERVTSPEECEQIMRSVFRLHECAEEYLYLICMDNRGKPLGFFEVSHGTCCYTPAGPREILIRALLCGAAGIILVHNHPGGDPEPSEDDRKLTGRIREAAALLGIRFHDHVIIGGSSFYSVREEEEKSAESDDSRV